MSSKVSRDAILAAVTAAAAPWSVYDLSDYVTLEQALSKVNSQAVLVQYTVADETQTTIGSGGNQHWSETGVVTLHLVTPAGFDSAAIVDKGDAIREALRGRRLTTDVVIYAVEPFLDFGNATGLYGGAWKGWAANLFYERRTC